MSVADQTNSSFHAIMAYPAKNKMGRRQSILAGIGAALAGPALAAAAARPQGDSPDAALIAACTEFEALEKTMVSWSPRGAAEILDDNTRVAAGEPLRARQDELVDIIFDTPAFTPAAMAARARAAIAYDPELIDGTGQYDGHSMVIIAAMLRDLIAAE